MADVEDRLVREIAGRVVAALRGGGGGGAPGASSAVIHPPIGQCTGDYSKFAELRAGAGVVGAPAPQAAVPAVKPVPAMVAAAPVVVLEGMITAARLRAHKGPIRLGAGARLTPLAQDYIREKHLSLSMDNASGQLPITNYQLPAIKPGHSTREVSMSAPSIFQMKQEMCEVGHRIWQKGFCAGNEGNHSIRIADDRVLCTPTGISKGFLRPDQITIVDMDGNQVDKENKHKRTSEILLHLAIYRKRADVKAVIHSHPPHATAFACAGVPIPEGIHPEAEVFLGKVPTAKYTTPSYKDLGESVVKLVTNETNTVLMGNHGSVNFGPTLMDAYYKLEILDAYCRILLLIKQVGKVNFLSQQEMVELLKVKEKFGMKDSRLACAPNGCVGSENEAFLAGFPEQSEASATCDCATGKVVPTAEGAGFEALVKQVTEQVMAGLRK